MLLCVQQSRKQDQREPLPPRGGVWHTHRWSSNNRKWSMNVQCRHLSAQQPQPQTPNVTTRTRFACTPQLNIPQTDTRDPSHVQTMLMLLVMLLAAAALSCCPGCPAAASTGTGRGSQCPAAAAHTSTATTRNTHQVSSRKRHHRKRHHHSEQKTSPIAHNSTTKCKADPIQVGLETSSRLQVHSSWCVVPCCVVLCRAVPCCVVPCCVVLCRVVLCRVVLCRAVLCASAHSPGR